MNFQNPEDTICALSSPQGTGAIALIRVSGKSAFQIVESIFSKKLSNQHSHTAHFGLIKNGENILDEVLVTIFKNPHSFTGEDLIEISCHGSQYIQKELLNLLTDNGARIAAPGEFSLRAFMNGKMDLSQTEAIADLISSNSKAAHQVAMHQMRGGFSEEISALRQQLLNFASLIELELDFSEEDVEFADRTELQALLTKIKEKVEKLLASFKFGNAIKNGVPVAIVGAPNAGKSTLLNAILNEERAIVSDIAGTTRDYIEDTIVLDGIEFRFIDTAGIRDTFDKIETLGIERAFKKIRSAQIVLLLFDLVDSEALEIKNQIREFEKASIQEDQTLICLFNKSDKVDLKTFDSIKNEGYFISAKDNEGVEEIKQLLVKTIRDKDRESETIVTNVRHYEILKKCKTSIDKIEMGLASEIPGDLLAMDIRETLDHLGAITGEITNDELLGNIFANFCIGK